jgi:hypothetical protein
VAGAAEAAAVPRVVGVEGGSCELASVEGPVVGVDAGLGAGVAVAVCLVCADTRWVLGEYATAEPLLVLAAVAALSGGAAALLCLTSVVFAAPAVGVLGAAGDGADGESSTSGHGDHAPGSTVVAYARGGAA